METNFKVQKIIKIIHHLSPQERGERKQKNSSLRKKNKDNYHCPLIVIS